MALCVHLTVGMKEWPSRSEIRQTKQARGTEAQRETVKQRRAAVHMCTDGRKRDSREPGCSHRRRHRDTAGEAAPGALPWLGREARRAYLCGASALGAHSSCLPPACRPSQRVPSGAWHGHSNFPLRYPLSAGTVLVCLWAQMERAVFWGRPAFPTPTAFPAGPLGLWVFVVSVVAVVFEPSLLFLAPGGILLQPHWGFES